MPETRSSLYTGAALKAVIEGYRARVTADSKRILQKNRMLQVRSKEYVDAQGSAHVRESIQKLIGPREWRYVSFAQFSRALIALGHRFFRTIQRSTASGGPREVCFVVDSLKNGIKSSFWVIVMLLLSIPLSDDVYERLYLAVDDDGADGGLYSAFKQLPVHTRLVLTDDATYPGEQLSHFLVLVKDSWHNAHAGKGGGMRVPSITILVPFMSLHSLSILKEIGGKSITVMNSEAFPSLFHGRPLSSVLSSDLYLEDKSILGKDYRSLYFDVLGVLPTNSLIIFEHKVADGLSIPHRWLNVGPCVSSKTTVAYRLRPDRASSLMQMLRRELEPELRAERHVFDLPGTLSERMLLAASTRIKGLIASSKRFRESYCSRVSLASPPPPSQAHASPPSQAHAPEFFPLLSPEFCDAGYRRFMRFHRRSKLSVLGLDLPPCRRPPYKHSSFPDPHLAARFKVRYAP